MKAQTMLCSNALQIELAHKTNKGERTRMKTSPALQRLTLFVILLVAVPCLLLQPAAANVEEKALAPVQTPSPITTVFLVRHAEKADAPREDPPLTTDGEKRAKRLAHILGRAGITAIYTSQYLRTKQTAEPLATQLGITPTVMTLTPNPTNPREISNQSLLAIVQDIQRRHAGETVLVVGHTNSVPPVIRMLRSNVVPTIDEQTFDNLFVLTIHRLEVAKLVQLKY
jgi:2,3-bisphosphoglycerate-dependent phosphoglycerate mutase